MLLRSISDLKFVDGMHVAIRPACVTAKRMQEVVTHEYRRFYSRMRIARAFMVGLVLRHRRLAAGQKAYLRTLRRAERLKEWMRLHLEFKFAPWVMLRIGRRRVLEFLRDPDYADYLARLEG